MTVQHRQLLTEQGILEDQLVSAARDIDDGADQWSSRKWLGSGAQSAHQGLAEPHNAGWDEGEGPHS